MTDWIFVHIPRTGGTSARKIMGFGLREPGEAHYPVRYLEQAFRKRWKEILRWTIVRHPLDRLVSIFCHLNPELSHDRKLFHEWLDQNMPASPRCPRILYEGSPGQIALAAPQWHYLVNREGFCGVQRLLRFERLEADLRILAKDLETPLHTLPHENRSDREPWPAYFEPRRYARMRLAYREDYENLGYQSEEGAG